MDRPNKFRELFAGAAYVDVTTGECRNYTQPGQKPAKPQPFQRDMKMAWQAAQRERKR